MRLSEYQLCNLLGTLLLGYPRSSVFFIGVFSISWIHLHYYSLPFSGAPCCLSPMTFLQATLGNAVFGTQGILWCGRPLAYDCALPRFCSSSYMSIDQRGCVVISHSAAVVGAAD